jgi:hypothetical protein
MRLVADDLTLAERPDLPDVHVEDEAAPTAPARTQDRVITRSRCSRTSSIS